jgi:short-subunit dehydrogenase
MTDSSPAQNPLIPRKRALVIGATGGLGSAFSRQLSAEGWELALIARDAQALDTLASEFAHAKSYPHDVRDVEKIPALFQRILADLGGIESIVYLPAYQPVIGSDEFDTEKDRTMIETNFLGAVACLNQAAILFDRMGSGQIVGISSVAGDRGRVGNPVYNSTKAALDTYLEALRNRLTRKGVNILTVKPGPIETPLLYAHRPGGRGIKPDKAARLIVRAMRQRKQLIYVPELWRWIMLVIRHMPSAIFHRLNF